MKLIKRFFCFVLTLALLAGNFSAAAFATDVTAAANADVIGSGACGENLTWVLTGDGTLVISGSGPMVSYENDDAPWGNYAENISSVVIEDGVTGIGAYAFSGFALTQVRIADSVERIGKSAFDCCWLEYLQLPANLQYIGDYAFSTNAFTEITIPKNVSYIGSNAFYCCWDLSKICVDGENAHYSSDDKGVLYNKDKTQLVKVPQNYQGSLVIPEGTREILYVAVADCMGITDVTLPSTLEKIGSFAFQHGTFTDIVIPAGVTRIDCCAFQEVYLETVTFKGDCPEIDEDAFESWYPDGDYLVAYYPAGNATWTSAALRDYGRPTIWNGIISEPEETEPGHTHDYQSVTISPTCTEPGYTTHTCACGYSYVNNYIAAVGHSFGAWYEIKAPTTEDEGEEVRYCTNCDYYEIRKTDRLNTEIVRSGSCGKYADTLTWTLTKDGRFTVSGTGPMNDYLNSTTSRSWCDIYTEPYWVRNVYIENGVSSIGTFAFYGCGNIDRVYIFGNLEEIGNYAFLNSYVDEIYFYGDAPSFPIYSYIPAYPTGCFSGVVATVYYPDNNPSWTAEKMKDYGGQITWIAWNPDPDDPETPEDPENPDSPAEDPDEETVTAEGECGNGVFWKIVGGTLYISGEGVVPNYYPVSMGMYGLETAPWYDYGKQITRIEIEEGVTEVGKNAFAGCANVLTVVVPEGVTHLEDESFAGCGLVAIELPASLKSVGRRAFFMCYNLTDVYYRGNEQGWEAISVGEHNEDLTEATMHYGCGLPDNIDDFLPKDPDESEEPAITQAVMRLREIVESNGTRTAVFGGYHTGSLVRYDITEQTDAGFLENKWEYLDNYLLITVQDRPRNQDGNPILLYALPVETLTGVATENIGYTDTVFVNDCVYPIADGVQLKPAYAGEVVVYHLNNDEVVGLEVPSCVEGTLVRYDDNTIEIVPKGSGGAIRRFGFYSDVAQWYRGFLQGDSEKPVYVSLYHLDGLVHKVDQWDGENYYDDLVDENQKGAAESLEESLKEFDEAYQYYLTQVNAILGNVSCLDEVSREKLIQMEAERMKEEDGKLGANIYINPVVPQYSEEAYLALAEYFLDLTETTIPNFSEVDFSRKDVSTQMIKKLAASIDVCEPMLYTYDNVTIEIVGMNNMGDSRGMIKYWENGYLRAEFSGFTKNPDKYKEIVESFADEMAQMSLNLAANVARAVCDDLLKPLCGQSISKLKKSAVEKILTKLASKFNGKIYDKLIEMGVGRIDTVLDKCYSFNKAANGMRKALKNADMQAINSYIEKYMNDTILDSTIKDAAVSQAVNRLNGAWDAINRAILDYVEANTVRTIYSRAQIKCPVTVAVYNSSGEQIGYVGDDNLWFTDAIYIRRLGEAKEILSLTEDALSYVITATEEGTMSCSFEMYDENHCPVGRLNYYDIPLSAQQVFSALPCLETETSAQPMAMVSGYQVIDAEEYVVLDKDSFVMIQCLMQTNTGEIGGTVKGANEYNRGDIVLLSAEPEEGYNFAGWFEGDTLVETQQLCQFSAKENRTLTAKFIKDESVHIDLDVDAGGVALGEGKYQTGTLVELVAAPYKGYSFAGWFVEDQLICAEQEYSFIASESVNISVKFEVLGEEPAYILGDVTGDGSIDTTDAYYIVLYYNEKMDLTAEQLMVADVNGDGAVDTTDAYYIVLFYNEKIDQFPG